MTNLAEIDAAANLPQFFIALPLKQRLFSYTIIHNFSSTFIDEMRFGFRRSSNNFPAGNLQYPGLSMFPNIQVDELGVNIGPDPNAPQFTIENNYQIVDNFTWIHGPHTFKFGGDYRDIISPQSFTQRVRGDYEYSTLQNFLRDEPPDTFGERNAGNNVYYGNQNIFYAFAQDDWKVRSNFTLNLGVNYSFQQMPLGARTSQPLNSLASVPGVLVFNTPKSQKWNFAPRFGFAWSPDFGSGMLGKWFPKDKTSIRAGASMGYDYIFDNLYILSNPPELQQTNDCPCANNPFLATGGLPQTPVAITSPAVARSVTGSYEPDQKVPYSITWTASIQRQFLRDWSLELRYIGTHGVHLLTQNRINVIPKVDPANGKPGLPTFLSAPTQAQLDALTLTLTQINARPSKDPFYTSAGFTSNVVAFLSNGSSIYHGGSATLQHRFAKNFQGTMAYTFSHMIDDTTAEVFSTVLSPRRVADFRNLRGERATSALDHKHRFVTSWIYDIPWMRHAKGLAGSLAGGWSLAGTYTYESGEMITIRSGNDSNLNGDSAGDRAIFNPSGTEGVGSTVTALHRTDGQTVGYLANNPNARYIQAGAGAVSNIGRNTFQSPAINNIDASVFKNFRTGEHSFIQFRADFLNALNHPQFVPGAVNDVQATSATSTAATLFNAVSPLTQNFLHAQDVFSSHPRVIQLALRWNF
ncbi:MAG: TonB-dependent receptor [Acidobacteria bacterium]|nr:TonB-dependent receptor [Acidobacteriota bacterium]